MTGHYFLALLAPIVILAVNENELGCKIEHSAIATCKNLEIQLSQSSELQKVAFVSFVSVSGDFKGNGLQLFPQARHLYILDSNITSFSLDSNISTLNVTNTVFPKVTSDVLKGCKRVNILHFMSDPGLVFEGSPFKFMKDLQDLVICNQSLPRVQRQLFEGLDHLMFLNLISNGIRDVDEDAFQDLVNLNGLFLDSNPIESLHLNFSGMKLKILSLLGTNLKTIDLDVISTAKYLTFISFPIKPLVGMNATILQQKVPRLKVVAILEFYLSCQEVVPILEDIKKTGVEIKTLGDRDMSHFKKFLPTEC